MSAHRHALHFPRPQSPLADAQRHVKEIGRRNGWIMGFVILATTIVGAIAILMLFHTTAH